MSKIDTTEESEIQTALKIRDNFRQIRYDIIQDLLQQKPDVNNMLARLDREPEKQQEDVDTLERLNIDVDLKKDIRKEINNVREGLRTILKDPDKTETLRTDSLDRQKRLNVLFGSVEKDAADMRSKVAADLVFILAKNDGKVDKKLLEDLERGLSAKREGTKPVVSLEAIRGDAIETLDSFRRNGILEPNDIKNDEKINEFIKSATTKLVSEISDDKTRQNLLYNYVKEKAMLQAPFYKEIKDEETGKSVAVSLLKQDQESIVKILSTHVDFSEINMSKLLSNSGVIVNEIGPIVQKHTTEFFGKSFKSEDTDTEAHAWDTTNLNDNTLKEFANKLKNDINALANSTPEDRQKNQDRIKDKCIGEILEANFRSLAKSNRTIDDTQKKVIIEKVSTTLKSLDIGYLLEKKGPITQQIGNELGNTNLGNASLISRMLGTNKLKTKQLQKICDDVKVEHTTAQQKWKEQNVPSIISNSSPGAPSTSSDQNKHNADVYKATHNEQFEKIRQTFNYNKPLPTPPILIQAQEQAVMTEISATTQPQLKKNSKPLPATPSVQPIAAKSNSKKPLPSIPTINHADHKTPAPTPQVEKKETTKIGSHRNSHKAGRAER